MRPVFKILRITAPQRDENARYFLIFFPGSFLIDGAIFNSKISIRHSQRHFRTGIFKTFWGMLFTCVDSPRSHILYKRQTKFREHDHASSHIYEEYFLFLEKSLTFSSGDPETVDLRIFRQFMQPKLENSQLFALFIFDFIAISKLLRCWFE